MFMSKLDGKCLEVLWRLFLNWSGKYKSKVKKNWKHNLNRDTWIFSHISRFLLLSWATHFIWVHFCSHTCLRTAIKCDFDAFNTGGGMCVLAFILNHVIPFPVYTKISVIWDRIVLLTCLSVFVISSTNSHVTQKMKWKICFFVCYILEGKQYPFTLESFFPSFTYFILFKV